MRTDFNLQPSTTIQTSTPVQASTTVQASAPKSPVLIVGLGNPGRGYASHRHNIGFEVLDGLAEKHGIRFSKKQGKAEVGEGLIAGRRVLLAKPQTYVNLSGESVRFLRGYYFLTPDRCLIVCDDLELPAGQVRIRAKGGSGGHNGLKSIIAELKTQEFPRIRVGIGRPPNEAERGRDEEEVTRHVLSPFRPDEQPVIDEAIERSLGAIETWTESGIEMAMSRYNIR